MKIMKKVLALLLALAVLSVPMVASAAEGDSVAMSSVTSIWNGDTVSVAAGATTYFEVGTGMNAGTFDFVVEGTGDFAVAICGEDTGDGPYIEGAPVDAVDGKVTTKITSYESTYNYGAFSITNNSGVDATYTCTVVFPLGSSDNPYAATLTLDEDSTITVPAGTQYYINATLPAYGTTYYLEISGATGFQWAPTHGGGVVADVDGVVAVEAVMARGPYAFCIVNNTESEQTYTLSLSDEFPTGWAYNPDELWLGETVSKDLVGQKYYYSWTSYESGTFKFAINSEASANWSYHIQCSNGDELKLDTVMSSAYGDSNEYYLNVVAEDTVTVGVWVPAYVNMYGGYFDAYSAGTGTVEFSTAFGTSGDVDCDGELTTNDLVMMRKGIIGIIEVDPSVPGAYDINMDGTLNILDLINIKIELAGPVLGDYEMPYALNVGDTRVGAYVKPGGTAWVKVDNSNGSVLTIGLATTADYMVMYCRQPNYPNTESGNNDLTLTLVDGADMFSIYNSGSTDVVVYMALAEGAVADTTGTMDDPEIVEIDPNSFWGTELSATHEAGNEGYWYQYTATADGLLDVQFYGCRDENYNDVGWMWFANNVTANKYGNNHWSDDAEPVYNEKLNVSAGDVIQVFVSPYNPDDMFNNPAGITTVCFTFSAIGSYNNPEEVTLVSTQKPGGTYLGAQVSHEMEEDASDYYYSVTLPADGGLQLSIINAVDSEGNVCGWEYEIDGDVHYSGEEEVVNQAVALGNEGDTISFRVSTRSTDPEDYSKPAGTVSFAVAFFAKGTNEAAEVIEETTTYATAIEEGAADGYYYQFTAPANGEVTISMADTNENGWVYTVINSSTGAVDTYTSLDATVTSSLTIDVAAGDELKVMISTISSESYLAPAGVVNWTFTYEAALGTQYNPYMLYVGNASPLGVTVNPGETVYVQVDDSNNSTLEVGYATGSYTIKYGWWNEFTPAEDAVDYALTATLDDPYTNTLRIENYNETAVTLRMLLHAGVPVDKTGTWEEPEVLTELGTYEVARAAGDDAYFYKYTVTENGTLNVTMNNAKGWQYCVSTIERADGTYYYGDIHRYTDEVVVSAENIAVSAGDVVTLWVSTADADGATCEGTVSWTLGVTAE